MQDEKDEKTDVNIKAILTAFIVYAVGMGLIGDFFANECGEHWFMYIVSFSFLAVPVLVVVWWVAYAVFEQSKIGGDVLYWAIAAGVAFVFFIGCFLYAHTLPALPFNVSDVCQPM
jgi:hypothetical protein